MNDTDLMKFHIAAVKMILSLDEPKLTEEKNKSVDRNFART